MEPTGVPTTKEAKRLAETTRKRKYRAAKHAELVELEAQVRRLRVYLSQCQSKVGVERLLRAKVENASLWTHVCQYHCLMHIISQWVYTNEHPQRDITHRPTWFESTLLAHPITRRQGIQWLSERVYHQARHTFPPSRDVMGKEYLLPLKHPFQGQVEMVFSFNAHQSDEIDDGVTIAALETRHRHTIPTDFRIAAALHWDKLIHVNNTIAKELIERVDDRFVYYHHRNRRIGTDILSIAECFPEDNRVVMTNCYVAKDELFPLGDGVLRPHGFSWIIYEAVSSGVTRVHNFALQYTPITAVGRVIPLERIGRLFGLSPAGVHHRDAYIEQIRTAAEGAFVDSDSHKAIARELSNST
ncbi:hypothetical protein AeMF1_013299 [Aphanomyces euteiches]|nr:hypothetical protein AeMF1_013299 [Aphanomyces euteiches]KAH9189369.1 hypothetical protein AeNC1_008655 [Aphanomyces euteiches]